MPTYELVGLYDCPFLAKAEKLLEQVQFQFPVVEYHKSMKDRVQWKDFVQKMKTMRGWTIKRSPVIWEVLVSPKGKANYIGDIDDLCEYVQAFFGITIENETTAALMEQVVLNKAAYKRGFQGFERGSKTICKLAIVNGSPRLLEGLLAQLLSPVSIIPPTILFEIRLHSDHLTQKELDGFAMEAVDMASANLFKVSVATSASEALYDCHMALMLDDYTKHVEEEPRDWFERIEWAALKSAEILNQVCASGCRILIGGDGPQCFVAEIFRRIVSKRKVQSGYIVALGQHVVSRAKGIISRKAKVPSGCISRVHAWGWPGSVGAYVEVKDAVIRDSEGSVQGPSPCEVPLGEMGLHPEWVFNHFAEEYLIGQHEQIHKTRIYPRPDLCLADAIAATLHIWFMSGVPSALQPQICCRPGPKPLGEPPDGDDVKNANEPASPSSFPFYALVPNDGLPKSGHSPVLEGGDQPLITDADLKNLELLLPVISVGVECSSKSKFPRGSFMVQPAVCYFGRWVPAGKISEATHSKILGQVSKLYEQRKQLIYAHVPPQEEKEPHPAPVPESANGEDGSADYEDEDEDDGDALLI